MLGGEYESKRGFSTGIMIDPPKIGGYEIASPRVWYFILLVAAAAALLICLNLMRSRTGRAWRAIRDRETVAEALGIGIAGYKLLAFVISSAMTAVAGALFAYYRNFVSVEAFSLFLTIQYAAMIIIGGMGSLLGALLGAVFVTIFPYIIEAGLMALPGAQRYASVLFAVNYAAFGVVMIAFLDIRAAGPRRHLAADPELSAAVAVQASAGRRSRADEPAACRRKARGRLQAVDHRRAGHHAEGRARPDRGGARTNGAGKTTTLRAISGFLGIDDARVTEGTIAFKGARIENRPPNEIARLGVVLVPERDKVFPNLTVAENLAAPVPRSVDKAERRRREALVYEFFPMLGDLRNRIGGLLSGGERQMLALGSALVCQPELLLIDELSLGLAPVVVEDLVQRIVEIRRELGITILMVEQNAAVALDIADYGYVLENGRVVLDGDGERLRSHADIQEFYLGQVGGERRSYRTVKQYRRSRRWYG